MISLGLNMVIIENLEWATRLKGELERPLPEGIDRYAVYCVILDSFSHALVNYWLEWLYLLVKGIIDYLLATVRIAMKPMAAP